MNGWTLVVSAVVSLSTNTTLTAEPSTDEPLPIYGGGPTETCEWPSTAFLGGCTGTLVHPQVVIYAAHCGSNVPSIWFGENSNQGGGRSVPTEFCRTYPNGTPGAGTDFAVCKLAQPVDDIPIVPILMGCETEVLTPGREVVAVGFGNTDTGAFGVKYEVTTTMNFIQNDEAQIGGGGKAPCHGDSGGPAFVRLSSAEGGDDTWRVFGITSWGGECGDGGYYSMMHEGIEWFESETGIDLTPCHDVDGTWNPGPDCGRFPLEPGVGQGSWDTACDPGPLGGWSDTCGEPYAVDEDGGSTGGVPGVPPDTSGDRPEDPQGSTGQGGPTPDDDDDDDDDEEADGTSGSEPGSAPFPAAYGMDGAAPGCACRSEPMKNRGWALLPWLVLLTTWVRRRGPADRR